MSRSSIFFFFFFNDTATTEIYTLSLHDALPIFHLIPDPKITYTVKSGREDFEKGHIPGAQFLDLQRSEEHTSELQSQSNLVCRLLLEKKKHAQAETRNPV